LIRKGIRPTFRFRSGWRRQGDEFAQSWPLRRSWIAILAVLAFAVVFLLPAIGAFRQAVNEWSRFESLFDLVGAVFITAWLTGWSIAPIGLILLALLMIVGREVVRVRPGQFELFIGLPLLGLAATYEIRHMRNLRVELPVPRSGRSWRGAHFAFDYGANSVAFGSDVEQDGRSALHGAIQSFGHSALRDGDPSSEEINGLWDPPEAAAGGPAVSAVAGQTPVGTGSASTLLLLVANLVPIAGTMFLGWKLSDVMVLYWAESAVIGFFNVLKIVTISRWQALFAAPFFLGHFGGFMAVHFLFIWSLFVKGVGDGTAAGGSLVEVGQMFSALWPALLALVFSHGFSFFTNFIGRREFLSRTIRTQMTEPYSRIVFMHLVLIFGGGLSLVLGESTPVLVLVIALKIAMDVRAHLKEHRSV
jgi:hypothetical protein